MAHVLRPLNFKKVQLYTLKSQLAEASQLVEVETKLMRSSIEVETRPGLLRMCKDLLCSEGSVKLGRDISVYHSPSSPMLMTLPMTSFL